MVPSETAVVISGGLVFLTLLVKSIVEFFTRIQDRKDAKEKEENDQKRRDRDKAERAENDKAIRIEIASRAQEIADKLILQEQVKRLQDEKAHAETMKKIGEIHETAKAAADGADRAYTEANHVNIKIEKVAEATHDVQVQLAQALQKLPQAPQTEDSPVKQIVGTFVGTAEP